MIIDYIIALVNLYGIVHKDMIIEIYNMQNHDKVDKETMQTIMKDKGQYLTENYVHIKDDYFVNMVIMALNTFDTELKVKKNKPYYIPEKQELLKYKSLGYFQVTEEYEILLSFLKKMFWRKAKAEDVCREIQINCQSFKGMENMPLLFQDKRIRFKSSKQLDELMLLIKDLADNTRVWQNNGFTPNEMDKLMN